MLVLPNTASAISERFTSPLKLFEYLQLGRPIVASDLPALREVLTTETAVFVPPGDAPALAKALERLACRPCRMRLARTRGSRARARVHVGPPGGAARRGVRRRDGPSMISARLFDIVECPDCRRPHRDRRATARDAAGASVSSTRRAGTSTCGPGPRSRSRPSTWRRSFTPTRGTNPSRRHCLDRASATTCCGGFSGCSPAIASIDLGCGNGRAIAWNARPARRSAASTSARISRPRPWTIRISCSAIFAACR